MQVPIPSEYRQSVRLFWNLDIGSFAILVISASVGFQTLHGHAALVIRIPEAIVIMGLGVAFALVRWPLDHGDRLMTWVMRAWRYYWRPKRGSAWGRP